MGYTRSWKGSTAPISEEARIKAAATADFFARARDTRRKAVQAGVAMPAAAPVGGAAASIAEQNRRMGIQDPAKAGGAAQAVPQNQPPIQGAGQAPQGQGAGQAPVAKKSSRGATDAPYSKAFLKGRKATQEWFNQANSNRQARMAREAEARRKTSQENR